MRLWKPEEHIINYLLTCGEIISNHIANRKQNFDKIVSYKFYYIPKKLGIPFTIYKLFKQLKSQGELEFVHKIEIKENLNSKKPETFCIEFFIDKEFINAVREYGFDMAYSMFILGNLSIQERKEGV